MHHKEIAVFFPLRKVLNKRERVKRVGEIGFKRHFKPMDIFHRIVRILYIMQMVEPVKLLFILNNIRGRGRNSYKKEKNAQDSRAYEP